MGSVKRSIYNAQLMASVNYNNLSCLRGLIKNMAGLESMAMRGDSVALSVLMDIRTVLGVYITYPKEQVLTNKQRRAIHLSLVLDMKQDEVAEEMGLSQQGVSFLVRSGLRRMRNFLNKGV